MRKQVSFPRALKIGLAGLAATLFFSVHVNAQQNAASAGATAAANPRQFLDRYCVSCHSDKLKTAGLSLAQVDLSKVSAQNDVWEKVMSKLHTGVMPPPNMPQPPDADRHATLTWLETSLVHGN